MIRKRRIPGEPRLHWLDPRMPHPPRCTEAQFQRWFPKGEDTCLNKAGFTYRDRHHRSAGRMDYWCQGEREENELEPRLPVDATGDLCYRSDAECQLGSLDLHLTKGEKP